jgi:hypothetical protein
VRVFGKYVVLNISDKNFFILEQNDTICGYLGASKQLIGARFYRGSDEWKNDLIKEIKILNELKDLEKQHSLEPTIVRGSVKTKQMFKLPFGKGDAKPKSLPPSMMAPANKYGEQASGAVYSSMPQPQQYLEAKTTLEQKVQFEEHPLVRTEDDALRDKSDSESEIPVSDSHVRANDDGVEPIKLPKTYKEVETLAASDTQTSLLSDNEYFVFNSDPQVEAKDQEDVYFDKSDLSNQDQQDDEYSSLDSDLPKPDSEVLFEAFSPKRITLEEAFSVTFAAYNFTEKKQVYNEMKEKGNVSAGIASRTVELAIRTPVGVVLKNPHKELKCPKQREDFIWMGEKMLVDFPFNYHPSIWSKKASQRTFSGLYFMVFVRDIEVARINFKLKLVCKNEPLDQIQDTQDHFFPEFTNGVQALFCKQDQIEYLRWRLALKCVYPSIRFLREGQQPSQKDIVTIFWSRSASIDLEFNRKWKNVLKNSKELRISVLVLDFATGLPRQLKALAIDKQQYFKKLTFSQSDGDFRQLTDMDLASHGLSHQERLADSAQIVVGKEIGRGFFGAAYIAKYGEKLVVVKKVALDKDPRAEDAIAILSEVSIMERCSGHRNTGRLIEAYDML